MSEKVVWEDVRKYGKLRMDESIDEALISLELLKQGKLRNSASKASMAFKVFLSGLVSINNSTFSSLLDEKERKFFYKIGFTAPSNMFILYSSLLE
ncbi:PaREP1 family protein [Acidianus ambivalens]|uniref:PaREP1 family protein n=1 Tax=Acidianus ambivalens TaxID=2283 RepID=UPI001E2BF63D|nr:PaREP1 family protein [Acidianus ambivalens]